MQATTAPVAGVAACAAALRGGAAASRRSSTTTNNNNRSLTMRGGGFGHNRRRSHVVRHPNSHVHTHTCPLARPFLAGMTSLFEVSDGARFWHKKYAFFARGLLSAAKGRAS